MREEERTRRERGEYARRKTHVYYTKKRESFQKETPTQRRRRIIARRASRLFLLPTTRKNARRSILIVPDTLVDATTPALARFYRRVRPTARRSRHHLSAQTLPLPFIQREKERERAPKTPREERKKKEAPTGGPTRDLRTPAQPPSLARSHKDRRENRGSSSIEKTRAARERERERERESHRVVPFFRSYKQNVKTMKVSSSPKTQKAKTFCTVGV